MKFRLGLVLLMSGIFLFSNKVLAVDNNIVITEIGAYEASGHEWIEIYNRSNNPVDLTDWKFWEDETNHGLKLVQGSTMVLQPKEYAIITQNDVNFKVDYPNVSVMIVDSSWSTLNESGENIGLKNSAGEFEEQFTYIAAKTFSLERINFDLNDYSSANWTEHVSGNTVGKNNSGASTSVNTNATSTSASTANNTVINNTITPTRISPLPEVLGYEIRSVVINEFVSDPIDEQEEFIELYNNSTNNIKLDGWWLEEGSGKKSLLQGIVAANGFFVKEKPSGSLNNTGDIIKLFDPAGGLIDQVTYGNWEDGNTKNNANRPDDPFSLSRIFDGQDTDNDKNDFVLNKIITRGSKNHFVTQENLIVINKSEVASSTMILSVEKNIETVTTTKTLLVLPVQKNTSITIQNYIDIEISEVVPDPIGSDDKEYIELFNAGKTDIDLSGLKLDDDEGGSRPYIFSEGEIIKAGEYKIFEKTITKLVLNNTNDVVRLLDTNDKVIAQVAYDKAIEGSSFVKDNDGEMVWTKNTTPSAENKIVPTVLITPSTIRTSYVGSAKIDELHNLDTGSVVKVIGSVAVLPNVFGSQYFYIINENAGIQLYMYKKDFPELSIGDEIEVSGEISQAYGEYRIKLKDKNSIKKTGQKKEITPVQMEIEQIQEGIVGSLAKVEGEITEIKTSYAYIDDGTDELKIYFKKNADINKSDLKIGNTVSVTGIVSEKSGEYQLLPRFDGDIEIISSSTASTAGFIGSSEKNDGQIAETYLTATAGGLTSILIGLFIKMRGSILLTLLKKSSGFVLAIAKKK